VSEPPASERRPVTRPPTYPSVEGCEHRGPAELCRRSTCRHYVSPDWDAIGREARLTRRWREMLVRAGSRCAVQLASDHGGMGTAEVAWLASESGVPLSRQRIEQLVGAALIRVRRLYRETPDGDLVAREGPAPVERLARRCPMCGAGIDDRPPSARRCVGCARVVAREKAAEARRRDA